MTSWAAACERALDDAASAALALEARIRGARRLRLVETAPDAFVCQGDGRRAELRDGAFVADPKFDLSGAAVELVLSEQRFLFTTLTVPLQAADILAAMIRSQIDRLTPWTRAEAAFGYVAAPPAEGRIEASIAAAPRAAIERLAAALEARGAASVAILAPLPGAQSVEVYARSVGRSGQVQRARNALAIGAALAFLFAGAAYGFDGWARSRSDEAAASLADLAARARARANPAGDPESAALLDRKRREPAIVVVLDALTRALPDDAYLTDLELSGRRLELHGAARGATKLVKRLEDQKPFVDVKFSAATTPAPGGEETFHLEAELATNEQARP